MMDNVTTINMFGNLNIIKNRQKAEIPMNYVQTKKVNDQKNTNCPRKIGGIYVSPAPNVQGGHQIMDLCKRKLITRKKLVEIPITDVVINAVEKCLRIRDLSHYNFTVKKERHYFP